MLLSCSLQCLSGAADQSTSRTPTSGAVDDDQGEDDQGEDDQGEDGSSQQRWVFVVYDTKVNSHRLKKCHIVLIQCRDIPFHGYSYVTVKQ